jgi:small subunit ribosomal protein S20
MADHKQAIKRHRQSEKLALRNSHYKSTMKTLVKKAFQAVESKSPDAKKAVDEAISMVDKIRGKGIIPRNRAGRYVSRLTRLMNQKQA